MKSVSIVCIISRHHKIQAINYLSLCLSVGLSVSLSLSRSLPLSLWVSLPPPLERDYLDRDLIWLFVIGPCWVIVPREDTQEGIAITLRHIYAHFTAL